MKAWGALFAMAVLLGIGYVGPGLAGLQFLFGVVIPYAAITIFLVGLIYRVLKWASSPVPFRIPTTSGPQKSLPWLKHSRMESPATGLQAVGRMALEVLLFRSLFRNTRTSVTPKEHVIHQSDKLLWVGALAFHWCFLIVFVRHLRLFLEPAPAFLHFLEQFDGFFQITTPTFLLSNVVIALALLYLLGRRLFSPYVRYISLPADYFALFLLIGVVGSGIFMRYITKVDLFAAKELALGLVTLRPVVPEGIGTPFYIHVFLVSALFAYFPFSKLMHMGGVFLSPTRNLANNNRTRRHINPWNPVVEPHTYEQWEDEFRDKLQAAGIPLDAE